MSRIARVRRLLPLAVAIVPALSSVSAAHACLFSSVPSAYADGVAARVVTDLPVTAQDKALWAPFAFRQHVVAGRRVRLREDMREVARSMGQGALHWTVHWLFGDGTRATGAAVTHTYRRPGRYRIEAQSYFVGASGLAGWYDFDVVGVTVSAR